MKMIGKMDQEGKNYMEWISVKDKLPDEGVKVLSYLSSYDEYKIDYIIHAPEPIWACVLERDQNVVTHWMTLPNLPNAFKRIDHPDGSVTWPKLGDPI